MTNVWVTGINTSTPLTAVEEFKLLGFKKLDPKSAGDEIGPEDLVIVLDANSRSLKRIRELKIPKSRCILIRNEPNVVCPRNYALSTERIFGKIIDVGRRLPSSTLSVPCPRKVWGQSAPPKLETRTDQPVLMNANKISLVKGELYSLRRALIHRVPTQLYGPNWDSTLVSRLKILLAEIWIAVSAGQSMSVRGLAYWFSKHPNWQGMSADKHETYLNYKYVFAIENSADYMSEKLMDALTAGCVPIYVGPSVDNFLIPSELVVQSSATVGSVLTGLDTARNIDKKSWREKLLEFLESPETKDFWDEKRIYGEIAKHILGSDRL